MHNFALVPVVERFNLCFVFVKCLIFLSLQTLGLLCIATAYHCERKLSVSDFFAWQSTKEIKKCNKDNFNQCIAAQGVTLLAMTQIFG